MEVRPVLSSKRNRPAVGSFGVPEFSISPKLVENSVHFGTSLTNQFYLQHMIERLENTYRGKKEKDTEPVGEPAARGSNYSLDHLLERPDQLFSSEMYQHDQPVPSPPPSEEEYRTVKQKEKPDETLSAAEAERTVHELQLAHLLDHSRGDIDYERREQFHHWQLFNQVELWLYHRSSPGRTDNVNYGRLL